MLLKDLHRSIILGPMITTVLIERMKIHDEYVNICLIENHHAFVHKHIFCVGKSNSD